MMKKYFIAGLLLFFALGSTAQKSDTLCIVQINDVYEISALQNGKVGGLARIATYIKSCQSKYPTYSVLAGDFLSPSVMGTAVVDDERLNGKQMVNGLNALGIDFVTFGNHEFDVGETALQKRINESNFEWISANVFRKEGTPFYKELKGEKKYFPRQVEISSTNDQFKVILFGLTLPSNTPPYSRFISYDSALQNVSFPKNSKRAMVIGLTHLSAKEDLDLLEKYPSIQMALGGHEHDNMFLTSSHQTHVAKADANGKSLYRHLIYRDRSKKLVVKSELIKIDERILPDSTVAEVVRGWEERVYRAFRKIGLEPTRGICKVTDTLSGLEASIRYEQNSLGKAINLALLDDEKADASFINAGAIRIDDNVTGPITELDVIRIMPFGNKIVEVEMRGELLDKMIRSNDSRKGLGGYLQLGRTISRNGDQVLINGVPIDLVKLYRIRTIEFLISGKEMRLEYFNGQNPLVVRVTPLLNEQNEPKDLRMAFISTLKKLYE